MRRLGLVVAAALVVTAHAQAATLTVAPQNFSPLRATLRVSAELSLERQVGVRLVRPNGRPVGWIVAPSRRRTLAIGWDGRIRGKRVPDGNYEVRLVYRSSVLATAPLRIDTHPPQLLDLHADNGNTPFAGDNALLTTISPNGDNFRERANISFRLRGTGDGDDGRDPHREGAQGVLHGDRPARPRPAHDDLGGRHRT